MHWCDLAILFATAAAAGAINAVAGGGTLLTFPSLLWAGGLVEKVANATSTVALWPGQLGSLWGYRDELAGSRRAILILAVPSLLGGLAGGLLLLYTSNETFKTLVPWLILTATMLFTIQEPIARRLRRRAAESGVAVGEEHFTRARWAAVIVFQFLVAVYGGYFGAGIGILMLAALGYLGFTNIHRMNGLKNINGMCINAVAAGLFIAKGLVDWPLALLMAVGAILGGYAGAGTARRLGQQNVRRLVIGIGLALTAWMLVH